MRKIIENQMQLGEVNISNIKFDIRSRDEIPKLLIGLQYIYSNTKIRKQIFEILKEIVPEKINVNDGRPGMVLWRILVLGTLRLCCDWDYDRLREMANNHGKIREMLGHGLKDESYIYALQTLKDNIGLFTPEILNKINTIVVHAGQEFLNKKKDEKLKGRCDSFVVETNVHFPTDISLLLDAIRKIIILISAACLKTEILGWRQKNYNLSQIKKYFHKARNARRSRAKSEIRKAKKVENIREAHIAYLNLVVSFLSKAEKALTDLLGHSDFPATECERIAHFISLAKILINQIERRVLKGEVIPHEEKIFSIFEEHTEWICKGKAGVPQELGLRVCILEDQNGFILEHLVMEKETDDKVAIKIVQAAKKNFPFLSSCSFDKGFYSPSNRTELRTILKTLIMPKKGKLSLLDKKEENSAEFVLSRRQHSAVESAINALENHSLNRCPDKGIDGFKRYVGLAVLARNLQIFGVKIQQKEFKKLKRRQRLAA